jgi:hypothetical protein
MNIIRQKANGYVMWIGDNEVFEQNGVFAVAGSGLGLSTADNELAQAPAPEQMFFSQCMTYNGEWAIADQAWYDLCWTQHCAAYNANQKALRAAAYPTESDPIFFQYQRGTATKSQWLAAIDAVQAKYPYIGQTPNTVAPADQPTVEGAQTL